MEIVYCLEKNSDYYNIKQKRNWVRRILGYIRVLNLKIPLPISNLFNFYSKFIYIYIS
jgi:hypothetical protein